MPPSLTWRAERRQLDLSLWPAAPVWSGMGMLVAGLLAIDGLAIGITTVLGQGMKPRFVGITGLSVAILAALVPAVLWQRFGREHIQIQPGRLRIVHDYRLFQRVRLERTFRELEAACWTDLDRPEQGWLMLRLDQERLRTRVVLPRTQLDEAVAVVQRFVETLPGKGRTMFVVHPN